MRKLYCKNNLRVHFDKYDLPLLVYRIPLVYDYIYVGLFWTFIYKECISRQYIQYYWRPDPYPIFEKKKNTDTEESKGVIF